MIFHSGLGLPLAFQSIMDGQLGDRESSDPKMLNLLNVITECAGTEDPWHRDAAAFPQWWRGCPKSPKLHDVLSENMQDFSDFRATAGKSGVHPGSYVRA